MQGKNTNMGLDYHSSYSRSDDSFYWSYKPEEKKSDDGNKDQKNEYKDDYDKADKAKDEYYSKKYAEEHKDDYDKHVKDHKDDYDSYAKEHKDDYDKYVKDHKDDYDNYVKDYDNYAKDGTQPDTTSANYASTDSVWA
jgi:hypothetical protein